jgi:copper(I)-binding protein
MNQPANAILANRTVRGLSLALLALAIAACGDTGAPSASDPVADAGVTAEAGADAAVAPTPADADATPAGAGGDCKPVLEDGWVRLGPPGMAMMAGFGTLRNPCDAPVAVVSASSPAFGSVELHETSVGEDGVSRMRPVPRLEIAADDGVMLMPGSLHLMLMQPVAPLEAGAAVDITFALEDGRAVAGQLEVRTAE